MDNRALWHKPVGSAGNKLKLALALLIGSMACTSAWAERGSHRGHGGHGGGRSHIGVVIGAPLFWPAYGPVWYGDPWYGWYGDPFYGYRYRPVPMEPPLYIERGAPGPAALWYFCSAPEGYYPYVKQCSTAWRPVAPRPVVR